MAQSRFYEQFSDPSDQETTLAEQIEQEELAVAELDKQSQALEEEKADLVKRTLVLHKKLEDGAGDFEEEFTIELGNINGNINVLLKKIIDINAAKERKNAVLRSLKTQNERLVRAESREKAERKAKKVKTKEGPTKPKGRLDNSVARAFDALDILVAVTDTENKQDTPQKPPEAGKVDKATKQQQTNKTAPVSKERTPQPQQEWKKPNFKRLSIPQLAEYKNNFEKELEREEWMLSGNQNAKGRSYKATPAEKVALQESINGIRALLTEIETVLTQKKEAKQAADDAKAKKSKKLTDTANTDDDAAEDDAEESENDDPDGDEEGVDDDTDSQEEDNEGTSDNTTRQPKSGDVQLKEKKTKKNKAMTPTPASGAERGTPAAPEQFTLTTALNKKGFAEYLAKFGDFEQDIEDGNTAEVEKYYEAFNKSEVAKKELTSIFKNEIKNDLGVTLEKAELDAITAFIEKERIDNPEEIVNLSGQIEAFRANAAAVTQRETEIAAAERDLEAKVASLGGDAGIATLKAEVQTQIQEMIAHNGKKLALEQGGASVGQRAKFARTQGKGFGWHMGNVFLGWAGFGKKVVEAELAKMATAANEMQAQVVAKKGSYETVEAAKAQLEVVKNQKEHMKALHTALKQVIFEAADSNKAIRDMVQAKMMKKLDDVINPADPTKRTLKQAEEQQKAFDKLKASETVRGSISDSDIEAKQAELDAAVEVEFQEEVTEAIKNFKTGDGGAFTKLESTLKPFFSGERAAKLGSKEGDEARDFILDTLDTKRNDPSNKGAKSILLSLLIRNLKQPATN